MMTLISLAISVAFLFSAAVTFGFPGMPLWEELAARHDHAAGALDRDALDFTGPGRAAELASSSRTPRCVVGDQTEEIRSRICGA
jgi:hypothetical protein